MNEMTTVHLFLRINISLSFTLHCFLQSVFVIFSGSGYLSSKKNGKFSSLFIQKQWKGICLLTLYIVKIMLHLNAKVNVIANLILTPCK